MVIVISILVALGRILGYKNEFVQALDHLWVGGLLGIWIYSKRDAFYGWIVLLLSLVEVSAFLIGKFH